MSYNRNFIILSLLASLGVSAQENCEKTDLEKVSSFVSGNCSARSIDEARQIVMNDETEVDSLCEGCKLALPDENGQIALASKKHLDALVKKSFAESAISEVRKSLSNNLMDLLKIRSHQFAADPSTIAKSCSISDWAQTECHEGKTLGDVLDSSTGENKILSQIQTQLAKEIYNNLNTSPKSGSLFVRGTQEMCLSDQEFQLATNQYQNSLITKELVLLVQKEANHSPAIDFSKDIISQLEEKLDRKTIKTLKKLQENPFFRQAMASKAGFENFFMATHPTDDQAKILDRLYNNKAAAEIAGRINKNCSTIKDTLVKSFCNKDFAKANITNKNPRMIAWAFPLSSTDHAAFNKQIASYCRTRENENKDAIRYDSLNELLSKDLPSEMKGIHFETASDTYYHDKITTPKKLVCDSLRQDPCAGKEETCSIVAFYKNSKLPNSPESKLIASRNAEVNTILRSFTGLKPNVDEETRKFLVMQGILPDTDGSITEPTEDQKPQSPSSYAAAQKQFASSNPKYSYSGNKSATQAPQGQPKQPTEFEAKSSVGHAVGPSEKIDPDTHQEEGAEYSVNETKGNILKRLAKQMGKANPKTTESASGGQAMEKSKRQTGTTHLANSQEPMDSQALNPGFEFQSNPSGHVSKLSEAPKKKDELNEAKQMMGANRSPASAGTTAEGQVTNTDKSRINLKQSPTGEAVIEVTLDEALKPTEMEAELLRLLNAQKLNIAVDEDKKITVLVNGKKVILTPFEDGFKIVKADDSLKPYLAAIQNFFIEHRKNSTRAQDLYHTIGKAKKLR